MTRHSPWEDPNVKRVLSMRPPEDVLLLPCQGCGSYGYYNQGSHFSCAWCDWFVEGVALDQVLDQGEVIFLSEYEEEETP